MTTTQTTLFKAGEEVTVRTLNKKLWKHCLRQLTALGYADHGKRPEGASRRTPKRHTILKDVPEKDILKQEANTALYTHTLADLLDDGRGEVEELKGEMEEWRDNMSGTGLENTEKYGEVEECAETLENALSELESIELDDDALKEWHVKAREATLVEYTVIVSECGSKAAESRDSRMANALDLLRTLQSQLEEFVQDHEDEGEDHWPEDIIDALKEKAEALENPISELEMIGFPGMF